MQVLVSLLVSVTLMEMMFAMGLRLNFTALAYSIHNNQAIVLRAAVLNYIFVPGITLVILIIFQPSAMIAAGLLILAACPAAPYGPPFTAIARGNLDLSVGLMVILAGSSSFLAPLLLHLLLPVVANDTHIIRIDAARLAGTLFMIQLLPLGLGLALGQWKPGLAEKLAKPASHASKVLNLMMVIVIGTLQFKLMADINLKILSAMLLLLAFSMIAGWLLGWPGKDNRKALSITTSLRNMSLSMVIATGSFPGSPALTAILIYAFVAGTGLLLTALVCRQTAVAD